MLCSNFEVLAAYIKTEFICYHFTKLIEFFLIKLTETEVISFDIFGTFPNLINSNTILKIND